MNQQEDQIHAIQLLFNIEEMNGIVTKIQSTVVDAKEKITKEKIFSVEELSFIKQILTEEIIKVDFLWEVLKIINIKISLKEDTMWYVVGVPMTEKVHSNMISIFPLTNNGLQITNIPSVVIKSDEKVVTTTMQEKYIQSHINTKPLSDYCLHPL